MLASKTGREAARPPRPVAEVVLLARPRYWRPRCAARNGHVHAPGAHTRRSSATPV